MVEGRLNLELGIEGSRAGTLEEHSREVAKSRPWGSRGCTRPSAWRIWIAAAVLLAAAPGVSAQDPAQNPLRAVMYFEQVLRVYTGKALDQNSLPDPSAFTIKIGGGAALGATNVGFCGIDCIALVLDLSQKVGIGDTVTVSYTKPPKNPLQQQPFTDLSVDNPLTATILSRVSTRRTSGIGSVKLEWNEVSASPSVRMYQVGYYKSSALELVWEDVRGGAAARSYTVTGLGEGVNYQFLTRAVNLAGFSLAEVTMQQTLVPNVETPSGFTATGGFRKLDLSWTAAGSTVTVERYQYRLSTDGGDNWSRWTDIPGSDVSTTAYTISDLPDATEYTVELRMRAGSLRSDAASTTATTNVETPSGFTATGGIRKLDLSWTAAGSTVTVERYQYRLSTDGGDNWSFWTDIPGSDVSTTAYTISDLPDATEYTVELRIRAAGSLRSDAASTTATTNVETPSGFTATGGIRKLDLSWTAAGSTVTVERYQYRLSTDGGDNWSRWTDIPGSDVSTTAYTISDLSDATEYTVELRIRAGSLRSDAASTTARTGTDNLPSGYKGAPSAPTDLRVTLSHSCHVDLYWSAPASNGGKAITKYEFRRKKQNGSFGSWSSDVGDPLTTQVTFGTLACDDYTFQVRAVNANGAGPSAAIDFTSLDEGPPNEPVELVAVGGFRRVALSWETPARTFNRIDYYQVRHRSGEQPYTSWTRIPNSNYQTTSHTLTGLADETPYDIQVRAVNSEGVGASAQRSATTVAAESEEPAPLTASFENVPVAHDGSSRFSFRVAFSEDIGISYVTMRDDAFEVDEGDVTGARRVDGRHDLWEITVEPDSREAVTITLNGGRDCGTTGAVCTRGDDPRPLSSSPSATVAGPDDDPAVTNTVATGAPTISGTAQVDETLTASVSDISDADGLDNASFAYQWIRGSADIEGATDSSYTLVSADEGETMKVRVTFTDDEGHEENLTSAASDPVEAAPEPLTATFTDVPSEHRGEGDTFTFGLTFSEEFGLSYKTLRDDDAFDVSGGEVRRAKRQQQGSNQSWTIHVEPSGHGPVTVTLPETTDCGATGAICTDDDRPLSHSLSATVAGPVGISVGDARVEEDDGAVLSFAVTLSRAASRALTVDYATSDGSAQAGADYTAASGTLTFQAGESPRTIEVTVLDDSHDDDGETLTLTLSNPSSGRLTDAEATGTIENRDPLPRALLARFGRTAAVHVVEHVEERLVAPRNPGFRGRVARRELRRGMERELAQSFLRQMGVSAGANGYGVGGHDPMAGSPGAGLGGMGSRGSLGMRGLARGGAGMPGAAGAVGAGVLMLGAGTGAMGGAGMMGGAPGPTSAAAGADRGLFGGGLHSMGLGGDNLLTGSAFAMNRESHGGILSFWSRGARSHFSGREGTLSLGGDVRTTMFGADYAKGPLVAGLSLSHSRGLGEYAGVAAGQVASAVTGLYPWLGYKATDRVTVWGVAGYGRGGLLLTPDSGTALESGLSMAMAAAGTRGELIADGAGGFGLAFKADALWVGTAIDGVDGPAGRLKATDAAVTRFRTGLEGSRAHTFAGRLSLRPSVEVGLRHDGGDAETGAGMDVGAGLIVSDSSTGLAVDVRVRTLLVHQAEGFRERGMALSLSYNPTPSTPLGFTAKVAPSWGGQAQSGADALWGRETMAGMGQGGLASGNRLDGEVGYGLPVGSRFVGTPRVGLSTSEYGRNYRVGYGLGVLDRGKVNFELGVDAQRRESPTQGEASNGFMGRATLGW